MKHRLEYQDNAQFNNLETVLIQNDVSCLYTYGSVEKGKLMHIAKLLEHLNNAVPFNVFPLRDCTLPLESVAAWRAGNYLPRYALAFIERMEQLENQKYNNSATKVH